VHFDALFRHEDKGGNLEVLKILKCSFIFTTDIFRQTGSAGFGLIWPGVSEIGLGASFIEKQETRSTRKCEKKILDITAALDREAAMEPFSSQNIAVNASLAFTKADASSCSCDPHAPVILPRT